MIENVIYLGIGLVVGVVYHAKLQPYVAAAWAWLKAKAAAHGIAIRRDAE
jgi:hypothetical protein